MLRSTGSRLIGLVVVMLLAAGVGLFVCRPWDHSRDPLRIAAETDGVVPTPEVFWPYGTPYGGLQDDVWAQAYIDFTTRYAAAFNARDFSDPRLNALIGDYFGNDTFGVGGTMAYALGPWPLKVLAVDEADDATSAEVTVCEVTDWELYRPLYSSDSRWRLSATVRTYVLSSDGSDIRLDKGVDSVFDGSGRCYLDATQVGYFVPTPPFGRGPLADGDVVIGSDGEVYWPYQERLSSSAEGGPQ